MTPSAARGVGATAEPRRVSSAVLLASVVTLAAVIPLTVLALRGGDAEQAPTEGLTLVVAGEATELSGAVLQAGADAELSIHGDDLIAAAWTLNTPDGFLLAEGRAVGAAPYRVDLPQGLLAGLQPGLYDLLTTVTLDDGSTERRAARFAVEAPS